MKGLPALIEYPVEMSTQRIRTLYTVSLVLLDSLLIALAFVLAYRLRVTIDWPEPLANQVPLSSYTGLFFIQLATIIVVLFLNRQYYIPRAVSRIDQIYYVFVSVSIGILIALAVTTIIFRNNEAVLDYPRAMLVYDWLLTMVLLTVGRILHNWLRKRLQDRGIGKDKVIVVGTGDTARMIIQRILWSPDLGYDLVGIVNGVDYPHIGDTVCTGQPMQFAPIPPFQPEHFGTLRNLKLDKYKQFNKGVEQLQEEGVVQIFFDVDGIRREPIVAGVGELQFDVVVARLASEYNVETMVQPIGYTVARWVLGEEKVIEQVAWSSQCLRVRDREGRLVVLFNSAWQANYYVEHNPQLQFLEIGQLVQWHI